MSNGTDNEYKSATPFDDVFKTECEKLKPFLVPLICELFNLDSAEVAIEDVDRLANEHYSLAKASENSRGIPERDTDSCIRIGNKTYHVECQSTDDGDILFRLVEYNMAIGLEYAVLDENNKKIIVELPASALMMLRKGSDGGQKFSQMTIEYRHGIQSISLNVPVMNVLSYSADDIYAKELYFLIPFYLIRFEKVFDKYKGAELEGSEEYDRIYSELNEYFARLREAYENDVISEDNARKLAELSRVIFNHIARQLAPNIRERMVSTMRGHVLELQEDRWLKQGEEKGEAKKLIDLVSRKIEKGKNASEIAEDLDEDSDIVQAIFDEAIKNPRNVDVNKIQQIIEKKKNENNSSGM